MSAKKQAKGKLAQDTAATETTGDELPAFHYPVVRKFTGKLQYRANDMERVEGTPFGPFMRGEVKEVRSQTAADGIVESGQFSHVAADTPVGQPEEYRPKSTKPAATATDTTTGSTGANETV